MKMGWVVVGIRNALNIFCSLRDLYIIWKRKEGANFWVFKRRSACFGWSAAEEKLLSKKKDIF